jgi:ParB family chromosome partitioning protein
MARKQSEYLAGILADDDQAGQSRSEAPSPPPSPGPASARATSALLGRQSALARIATGEVRQITQLLLDPSRVRIWPGNPRLQEQLDEESARDLIDSIIAEGGLKVPVVVRRLDDDPEHDYELIAGTRRHFAIRWLRANSYPDMRLLAQLVDWNDEAAFRFADIENRARADISDLERARSYAQALEAHYGGHQSRMAERLHISKGWLSKLLRVASIPDEIVQGFAKPSDVELKPAYALAQLLDDAGRRRAIVEEARRIAEEQSAARRSGRPALSGPEVFRRLAQAGRTTAAPAELFTGQSRLGRPALSVTASGRRGVSIKVHAASGASADELTALFLEALTHHGLLSRSG